MNCSDNTATRIDKEIQRIIKKSYNKAYKLLKENEEVLDALAGHLIEKETITGKEFVKIYEELTGNRLKEAVLDKELEPNEEDSVQEVTSTVE